MPSTAGPAHRRVGDEPVEATAQPSPRLAASAAGWGGRVLAWVFLFAALAVLMVAVIVPRLGGATPYEVLTGSMKPGLPPGTLVVMKPASPTDIGVGSVVTYQLRSGEPTVVTHRVVEVRNSVEGDIEYITQGDANDVADEQPVRPEQIRGSLWYAVPQLGRVNSMINGQDRQLLVYGAAALLALYAGTMFAGAGRDRAHRTPGRRSR